MGWMKYEQHLIHKASFVLPFFNKKKNVELMPVVKFPQKGVDMDNGGGFHTRWTTDISNGALVISAIKWQSIPRMEKKFMCFTARSLSKASNLS
jgi:hypothetical protein